MLQWAEAVSGILVLRLDEGREWDKIPLPELGSHWPLCSRASFQATPSTPHSVLCQQGPRQEHDPHHILSTCVAIIAPFQFSLARIL